MIIQYLLEDLNRRLECTIQPQELQKSTGNYHKETPGDKANKE